MTRTTQSDIKRPWSHSLPPKSSSSSLTRIQSSSNKSKDSTSTSTSTRTSTFHHPSTEESSVKSTEEREAPQDSAADAETIISAARSAISSTTASSTSASTVSSSNDSSVRPLPVLDRTATATATGASLAPRTTNMPSSSNKSTTTATNTSSESTTISPRRKRTTTTASTTVSSSNHTAAISKIFLSAIQSDPSNRTCAECRVPLVDPSQVYASLCRLVLDNVSDDASNRSDWTDSGYHQGNNNNNAQKVAVSMHDFALTHQALAPRPSLVIGSADPAETINQRLGGHGVFVCSGCAEAHQHLQESTTHQENSSTSLQVVSIVRRVQEAAAWTLDEALAVQQAGGNSTSWTIYEHYLATHPSWKERRPTPTSSLEDRLLFCRAKYQALAFVLPPPGPVSDLAWRSLLNRTTTANKNNIYYSSKALRDIRRLAPTVSAMNVMKSNSRIQLNANGLPERLIDHFCVVSPIASNENDSMHLQLHPQELTKDLSKLNSPEDLYLWPRLTDCFPAQDRHGDMQFPEHLPTFCLPDGCAPSTTQKDPTFYTFCLTDANGDKLYGGALLVYDQHLESLEILSQSLRDSGYEGQLPSFLPDVATKKQTDTTSEDDDSSSLGSHSADSENNEHSEILFLPKCLVLLSHYPFFDLFRESLLQLYRITLLEAPLPIERYISNLVMEVPLPPLGQVKVEFGFTTEAPIFIERPPPNKLPMVNFSYRPLFASLSVANIMVVLGCLLQESKVALLSQHYSLLTPVAEGLLSALFPFEWQGLYIPLMPRTMVDLLEAPVPFLVGLHSDYLATTPVQNRPAHVVFVDLDRDVVHLGVDEVTGMARSIPELPSRDAMKLRTALEAAGGSMYLLPSSGIQGCIMEGSPSRKQLLLVPNDHRPRYAQMQSTTTLLPNHGRNGGGQDANDELIMGRKEILALSCKAFDSKELVTGFRSVHGQLKTHGSSDSHSDSEGGKRRPRSSSNKRTPTKTTSNGLGRNLGNLFTPPKVGGNGNPLQNHRERRREEQLRQQSLEAKDQSHLLDMDDPSGFAPTDIRNAFLRFMVTIFANYGKFILEGPTRSPSSRGGGKQSLTANDLFDEKRFLRDLGFEKEATDFVQSILETQFFRRFLEEREEDSDVPEIRFFDESILAKLNRSKRTQMSKGGKLPTPFLDDDSKKITQVYTPPPPNNFGLPDSVESYHYSQFPSFDIGLVGRVRKPKQWKNDRRQSQRLRSQRFATSTQQKNRDIVNRAMKPLISPEALAVVARRSARDLESALLTLREIGRSMSRGGSTKHGTSSRGKKNGKPRRQSTSQSSSSQQSPSTKIGKASKSGVATLSRADTIILSARRKQAILLDVVITLQATCRMYMVRSKYVTCRRAVICLQRKLRQIPLPTKAEKHIDLNIHSILKLQSVSRKFLAARRYQRWLHSVSILQRQIRCWLAKQRIKKMMACAALIQSHARRRRCELRFAILRGMVCRVQARVRGGQLRRRVFAVVGAKLAFYREQIIAMWQLGHISLCLRTKLWSSFRGGKSFARLKLAENEVTRMRSALGLSLETSQYQFVDDTAKLSAVVGIPNLVYSIAKVNPAKLDPATTSQKEGMSPHLRKAYEIEEAERLQIHERLDGSTSSIVIEKLYEEFGISSTEKMKKVALARQIWSTLKSSETSERCMLELFPELGGALSLVVQAPSSKSKRRFPDAKKVDSLVIDTVRWENASLECLLKRHLQEVTSLYITRVPSIMAKLQAMDQRKSTRVMKLGHEKALKSLKDLPVASKRSILQAYLRNRYENEVDAFPATVTSEIFARIGKAKSSR